MRLRIAIAVGAVGMAIGVLLPSAASAKIVVGQSIDGVKLGMTEAEVEAVTGPPGFKEPPDFEGHIAWKYPAGLEGAVGFDKEGRVEGLWTSSKSQKTSKGIGPFSSYAKFRRAYPKLKCGPGPWVPKKSLDCEIKGTFQGKPVVTSILFYTKALGVREVDLGYAS
jgi:hypothetical protein